LRLLRGSSTGFDASPLVSVVPEIAEEVHSKLATFVVLTSFVPAARLISTPVPAVYGNPIEQGVWFAEQRLAPEAPPGSTRNKRPAERTSKRQRSRGFMASSCRR
jgi:hypothetical protein